MATLISVIIDNETYELTRPLELEEPIGRKRLIKALINALNKANQYNEELEEENKELKLRLNSLYGSKEVSNAKEKNE